MQLALLNLIGMVLSVGVIIAPYALLRSLDTRSRVMPIIAGLTVACAVIVWPVALYFVLAVIVPVFIMHRMHKNMPPDAVSWMPVTLVPVPACALLLIVLALFSSNILSAGSAMLDVFYSHSGSLPGVELPDRDQLNEMLVSVLRMSPAILYVSIAVVFYFTERFYYTPSARQNPVDAERRRLGQTERRRVIMPMPDFFIGLLLVSVIFLALPFVIAGEKNDSLAESASLMTAVGINGLIMTATLYFFRGLDIIRYYFARWGVSPLIVGVLYFLILIYQPVTALVAVFGFASVYVNFIRDGADSGRKKI